MLTKNAIGNMINRYTAVLKKCRLLNAFGTLALVGTLSLGAFCGLGVCVGDAYAAYEPTLDDTTIQSIIIDNVKALDEDGAPSVTLPKYYDETSSSWLSYTSWADYAADLSIILSNAGISSAYMVEEYTETNASSYYTPLL